MAEPTKLKVELALVPSVVMAAMQTTMMRASITAYSTAVGPSSAFRNDTRFLVRLRIGDPCWRYRISGLRAEGYFGLIEEPTKLNVLLAFEPRVVMAAMQTTMIRASITAYSTAVGPSSAFR